MFGINNDKIRLLQESMGIRSKSVEITRKKKKRVSKLGITRVKHSEFVKKSDDFDFSRMCTSESEGGIYINEIAPTSIEESINKYENGVKVVENDVKVVENAPKNNVKVVENVPKTTTNTLGNIPKTTEITHKNIPVITENVSKNDVKTYETIPKNTPIITETTPKNTPNITETTPKNKPSKDIIHKTETENTIITTILSTPTPKETFHRSTLSISDFHFVHSTNYNDIDYYSSILRINLTKNDPIYHVLSPYYHEKFFDHNIPEIRNKAPTIQQLFVELLVHPEELDCFGNILPSFFTNINENFFLSKNARERKYKSKPKYYYYIDPETHKPTYLDLQKTHTLFMKTYITHIQTHHSQLINFIREIALQSKNIIISGPSITKQDYSIYYLDNKLHDKSHLLNPEFCFAKLLIS